MPAASGPTHFASFEIDSTKPFPAAATAPACFMTETKAPRWSAAARVGRALEGVEVPLGGPTLLGGEPEASELLPQCSNHLSRPGVGAGAHLRAARALPLRAHGPQHWVVGRASYVAIRGRSQRRLGFGHRRPTPRPSRSHRGRGCRAELRLAARRSRSRDLHRLGDDSSVGLRMAPPTPLTIRLRRCKRVPGAM
jgi:hypothetical protein